MLKRFALALVMAFGAGAASAQTLAYVADPLGVLVIDTATNTVIATFPLADVVGEVAATPNGAFVRPAPECP